MEIGAAEEPAHRDYTSGAAGLLADLAALHDDRASADVALLAGADAEPVPAHSCMLAARCPTLVPSIRAFLEKHPRNVAAAPPVAPAVLQLALPHVAPRTLRAVVRYVYTGRIRLRSADLLRTMLAAETLGMHRLARLASEHLRRTTGPTNVLSFLSQALHLRLPAAQVELVRYVSEEAALVIGRDEFCCLPLDTVLYIVKQEDLSISEGELWRALVKWACIRAGVAAYLSVSRMDAEERARVRPLLRPFVRPGHVRMLNMRVKTFALEVEPLQLLSEDEVLLKYRYEATAELAPFESAFPLNRVDFLTRIRQQSVAFASSHPHLRGVTEKVEVLLPSWTRIARITFDARCKLGRYADLTFYENDACTAKIASLDAVLASHRVARRTCSAPREATLSVPHRRFWYVMYAPGSFDAAWGFAFRVCPSIV